MEWVPLIGNENAASTFAALAAIGFMATFAGACMAGSGNENDMDALVMVGLGTAFVSAWVTVISVVLALFIFAANAQNEASAAPERAAQENPVLVRQASPAEAVSREQEVVQSRSVSER